MAGVEVLIDGQLQAPTVVESEPDVSAVSHAESVNEALRLLIKVAKGAQELAKAS